MASMVVPDSPNRSTSSNAASWMACRVASFFLSRCDWTGAVTLTAYTLPRNLHSVQKITPGISAFSADVLDKVTACDAVPPLSILGPFIQWEGPMAADQQCDVLVVGSGAGALAGALRAATAGLRTVVIERSDQFGGTTAYSGAACGCPCPGPASGPGWPTPGKTSTATSTPPSGRSTVSCGTPTSTP